jgi:hypothetical protein
MVRSTHAPGVPHDRQHDRVGRLGKEQTGHPLDVGDDPPAFGHHAGHHREAPVEEHNLRHGASGGCAVAHGDADVGVLESQRVVDAVTRHGDKFSIVLQLFYLF